jgi:hypothetical protein
MASNPTISASFTSTVSGALQILKPGEILNYVITGTWAATIILERRHKGGGAWEQITSTTANVNAVLENRTLIDQYYRWRCSAFTSGTAVTTLVDKASDPVDRFVDSYGNVILDITDSGVDVTGALTASDAIMIGPTSTTYLLDVQKTGAGDFINFERTGGLGYLRIGFDSAETNISSGTVLTFDTHGGAQQFVLSSTAAVFNEDSGARDFRVEGTSSDHLLFVDSSTDSVSIGVNNVTPAVTANRPFQIAANDATAQQLLFDNTGSGYWIEEFDCNKNGDGQVLYHFQVHGEDEDNNIHRYAEMYVYTVLDNAGAETGRFLFRPSVAGTVADVLSITGAVGDVGINVDGIIRVTDAAGPAMLNDCAEQTVPTIIPNRADTNSGIGWQSTGNISFISGGTEGIRMSATRTLNRIVPHFMAGMQIFNLGNPGTLDGGVYITARDSSVGAADSTLAIDLEAAPIVIGSFTASHKFPIWINNAEYHIQLDAV